MTPPKSSTRFVIIANGPLPDPEQIRPHLQPDDWLICADGGAHHAHALGLRPDLVIGDMDSLAPALRAEMEAAGVPFEVHPVNKDETDLELALAWAIERGATAIDVLAVLGGRLDQSLANLLLLTRPEWAAARLRAIAAGEVAWPVRGGERITIPGRPGDRLSLVPLSPEVTGVTFEGVKWPLHEATLPLGSTWGISNELVTPPARLEIGEGLVLVVHLVSQW